jgi:DNA repair exonuclease SbcCD ATPase subunit
MFIYHLSDIHITNYKRTEEYEQVFKTLYNTIASYKDKNKIIVITGDTYNDKCRISPESLILFQNLLITLSKLGKIIIIDGNHDININNDMHESSIYASIKNLKTKKNIYYLHDDNLSVKIGKINFVLTPMTHNVTKINKVDDEYYIALYHGTLYKTQLANYEITDSKIKAQDFKDYDITMLGDVHKHQYLNKQKTVAYASSLIQQNYGESVDKHGLIRWNVKTKASEFIEIHNDVAYVKCSITDNVLYNCDTYFLNTKKSLHIEFNYDRDKKDCINDVLNDLQTRFTICSYRTKEIEQKKETNVIENRSKNIIDIYKELVLKNNEAIDNYIVSTLEKYETDNIRNKEIKLKKLQFKNLFSYVGINEIIFEDKTGIMTICGDNGAGKTSIIDIIMHTLYDKFSRGKGKEALNVNSNSGYAYLWFSVNNVEYRIERHTSKKPSVSLYRKNENISNTCKKDTDADIKNITGDFETFNALCISSQEGMNLLNMNDADKLLLFHNVLNISAYTTLYNNTLNSVKLTKKYITEKENKLFIPREKVKTESLLYENIRLNDTEKQKLENEIYVLRGTGIEYELKIKDLNISNIDYDDKIKELERTLLIEKRKNVNVEEYKEKISILKNSCVIPCDNIDTLKNDKIKLEKELTQISASQYIKTPNKIDPNTFKTHIVQSCKFNKKCNDCVSNKTLLECDDMYSCISSLLNETERLKENEFNTDKNNKMNVLKDKITECVRHIENIRLYNNNMKFIGEYEKEIENINVILNIITTIETNLDNMYSLKQQNEQYYEMKKNLDITNKKIACLKDKYDTCVVNEITYNRDFGSITEIKNMIDREVIEITELHNVNAQNRKILDLFDKYKIINYVVDEYVLRLECVINNVLSLIVDYKIKIHQEDTELKMYKCDSVSNVSLNMLSGNEKFLMNIALKIALNKLGLSYKSDFMIIDEGFGTCDTDKLKKMNDVFDMLRHEFNLCIVISHIDHIKNLENNNVKVEKNNGISKIVNS